MTIRKTYTNGRHQRRRLERGFTLIELLIVVAIIAILAAIAIPTFSKYRIRTYKAELDSDAKNVYSAAQAYLTDNSTATVDSLAKLISGGYNRTIDVLFDDASITLISGNVEIHSSTLQALGKDNNAVIFFNGRIESANAP